MDRNPPDGTGPVHVPLGHVVANEKWRGSQLAQGMQEADLVAGNSYRKRLVRVRNSSNLQGIVLVEKTPTSEQYFPAIQKFTVLDLGMALLPVASQMEASCIIIQLVQEQTQEPRKNPFLRKKPAQLSEPFLLRTVQQIPGVGKVKASLLLQEFPSIQQLSHAPVQGLEQVVGQAAAQQIHAFFTQPR
ncbi:Fanconi anemia core complex-associated protein 24 isoform X2 [Eptesicus fuscus]|uniref:Fanconi anemia core complex-associated protein 24 isoform X2 n=1 Tax=Eptesicus fuscus TaxID=29078 RepID=UPI002403D604|nr:Fanconi anemia core complex-associated protein 24 isoform X2 [Eptesicus fuscus]